VSYLEIKNPVTRGLVRLIVIADLN